MSQNQVIIVAGATASGKSQLAIDLALELNGVIINADASQIYKGIPIIAASPSYNDKKIVEHKLYEYVDDEVNSNVVAWLKDVVEAIRQTWKQGKTPVVVGGSGLYIDNLVNGTTPIPEVTPEVRAEALEILEKQGVDALYAKLQELDPKAAAIVKPKDTTRVRRAYEIFCQTGISIEQWYQKPMLKKLPEAKFFIIKLLPCKAELDVSCNLRFAQMLQIGALDEIAKLNEKNLDPSLPVMRAQGVPEIIAFLRGVLSLPEAVELAQIHTRQYAKRQITWFKNKLKADITINQCYNGEKDFIENIKNLLHKSP